ncbi:MAG: DUF2914 domain-containing protein [Myxococcales bacterium]|nr:DUF2914 domain-containing protein [Myxococcales bacterium]
MNARRATFALLVCGAVACGKKEGDASAPGEAAPANEAALREEIKAELKAELLAELAREKAGGAEAAAAEAEPESDSRVVTGRLGGHEGAHVPADEALADEPEPPPIRPAPMQADPPAGADEPVDEPAPLVKRPVDDEFVDEPAGGAAPVKRDTPPLRDDPRRELPPGRAPFPESDPTEATASVSDLTVVEFVVAEGVDREQRVPVEPGTRFKLSAGKIYAYAVVKNPGEPTQVGIEWVRGDEVKSRLYLKVGKSLSGWRTWSSLKLESDFAGKWTARLVDSRGNLIKNIPFVVR